MKLPVLVCWTILVMPALGGQSQLQIDPNSESAVKQLAAVADAIEHCPRQLSSEKQWGKKPNEIERWYIGPPQNVIWDVERASSVRSPYLGYIEFSLEYKQWIPEEVKGKYQDRFGLGSVLLSQGPVKHRYEFDLGPDGLKLTRMLYGKHADQDESADDSCWQKSARATPQGSSRASIHTTALHGDSSGEQPEKPEAIGGKHYSQSECVQIARWVTADEKRLEALSGVEVGNFWYTLDSCGFWYFSDRQTMSKRPSMDELELETAIDRATHEYIARLDFAIQSLSLDERIRAIDQLEKVAPVPKDRPLFTLAPAGK